MTTDTQLDGARAAGRRLGLDLVRNIATTGPSTSLRRATVVRVNLTAGDYTADLTVAGATLHAIPITTDCIACKPGDRVLVETYGTQSFVTGVLARTSSVGPLFEWSSDWAGTPGSGEHVEKNATVTCGGLICCEFAANVKGTGEYGVFFEFRDANNKLTAAWVASSPMKSNANSVLRWVVSGTVRLPYGEYTITLKTTQWGSVSVVSDGLKWVDAAWPNGVPRYARLRMA